MELKEYERQTIKPSKQQTSYGIYIYIYIYIYILILVDTLLLRPSLHFTTLVDTTSSHLKFTQLHFTTLPIIIIVIIIIIIIMVLMSDTPKGMLPSNSTNKLQ